MLWKTGCLMILFISVQNLFAIDKIIPCTTKQCNNIPLLQAAAFKNSKNFLRQNFNMYFYGWESKRLIKFKVVYPTNDRNSIGILGPFEGKKQMIDYLNNIYSYSQGFLIGLGINIPEKKRPIESDLIDVGYSADYFLMHDWSIITLNGAKNTFAKKRWYRTLKKQITEALIIQGNFKNKRELKEKLNTSMLSYIFSIKKLNHYQIFPRYMGMYYQKNFLPITQKMTYYPKSINILMKDGKIELFWNTYLDDWEIRAISDLEGNVVTTTTPTGQMKIKIPPLVIVSKTNLRFWESLFKNSNNVYLEQKLSQLDFKNKDYYSFNTRK